MARTGKGIRRKRLILVAAATGMSLVGSMPALACWACLETFLLRADCVVSGTLSQPLEHTLFADKGKLEFGIYDLTVKSVLKGNPQLKSLRVALPVSRTTVDPDHSDSEAVWVLVKDFERNIYFSSFPLSQHAMLKDPAVQTMLTAHAKLPGGQPHEGLQLHLSVQRAGHLKQVSPQDLHATGTITAPADAYRLVVMIRNISDAPITVCNRFRDFPVSLNVTSRDGTRRNLGGATLYGTPPTGATASAPRNQDFTTLNPGAFLRVRGFGPEILPTGDSLDIAAVFSTSRRGKNCGIKAAWTGTLTSNAITLNRHSEQD